MCSVNISNGKQIFVVQERMNPNTPIHEYGHIWVESYAEQHPEEWKKVIEQLK